MRRSRRSVDYGPLLPVLMRRAQGGSVIGLTAHLAGRGSVDLQKLSFSTFSYCQAKPDATLPSNSWRHWQRSMGIAIRIVGAGRRWGRQCGSKGGRGRSVRPGYLLLRDV